MFILEEPYVSDLLATTVAELGLPVLRTPMAERRLAGPHAQLICDDEAFAAAACRPGARLYSNSENAIGWIAEHLAHSDLPGRIELFKDKIAFRDLLADLYPDYRYVGLPLSGLRAFDPSLLRAPFIVKPAVGFFSLGVHVVESAAAWPAVVARDRARGRGVGALYPEQVLDLEHFVVEEVIDGEEFAVDAYYDGDGEPVIVNVYAHLFALGRRRERPRLPDERPRPSRASARRRWSSSPRSAAAPASPTSPSTPSCASTAPAPSRPSRSTRCASAAGARPTSRTSPTAWTPTAATCSANTRTGRASPRRRPAAPRRSSSPTCRAPWTSRPSSRSTTSASPLASAGCWSCGPTDFNRYPVFAFTFVEVPSDDLSELHAVLGADLRDHLRMTEPARPERGRP